jgi:hypothetical protein
MGEIESYPWLIGGAVGIAVFLGVLSVGTWLMRRAGSIPGRPTGLLPLLKIQFVEPMREAEPEILRRSASIVGWSLLLTATIVGTATVLFAAVHALLTSGVI